MQRMLLGLTVAASLASAARAADVDPYLPADTEAVLSVNVEQMMKTPLGQKVLAPYLLKQLAKDERAAGFLKAAGIDPLTDFKRVNLAGTVSGLANQELMFAVAYGKFDAAKIRDAAAKLAESDKERVKIHKEGDATVYELVGGDRTLFAGVVGDTTLIYASSKKAVADALGRGGKEPTLKKVLANLMAKGDDKAAAYLIVDTAGATNQIPVPLEDNQKKALDSMHAITGTVAVDADAKIALAMHTKDAESAKALNDLLVEALDQVKAFVPLLAGMNPQLQPVVDLLNSIENGAKDKAVRLSGTVPGASLEKLLTQPKEN